jgi:TP901 family phage tail tape measure protein
MKRFSIEAIFTAKDLMTRPMARIEGRAAKMARVMSTSLKGVDRAFGSVHRAIAKTTMAFAGMSAAGAVVGNSLLRSGADFEAAMSSVAAVSLMTRDQVQDLDAEARRLGKSTKFTATEVAGAMELMGRAGFSNAAILKQVGGVLAASAAEGIEMAEAASIISNAIKGMGLDVERDAGRVADVLALASARTNSSMSSLGESLSNVAATARQFRVPFESTVAAVALLQDVGLDASVAGTSLNSMLTKLATPTDAVRAKMRKLGVSFQDAKGNMLPIEGVLSNVLMGLQKSGGNLEQAALVTDLFGMYGQKAAANLAEMARKGDFTKLVRELEAASGSAEKMAEIRMDNLLGDWEKFTGAVDGIQLALFATSNGPLRDLVQGWTKWAEANEDLIAAEIGEWLQAFVKNLPGILKDAKDLGTEVYGIAKSVGSAAKAIEGLLPGLKTTGELVLGFYALKTAVGVTRGGLEAYAKAAEVTKGMQGLLRGTVGGTGTALEAATKASDVYAEALGKWGNETTGPAGAFTKLKNGINGVESKLGKAGLLGAAALVGYELGSWADKKWGISDQIADWLADLTGVNDTLKEIGRTSKRGSGVNGPAPASALVNQSVMPIDRALGTNAAPPPQVVEPGERQRALLEEHVTRSESEIREKVDVTINDRTGSAQVRRHSGGRSNARIKLKPTGAY